MEQDSGQLIKEAFLAASRGTLVERMGITIQQASAERVVGSMPVPGNTQPYGLLHGGASCVLAETLGSLGSALHAGPERVTMGVEINATHHRAATGGTVTGVATRLHGGRTVTSYEIAISDDRGRRVCTARLTCLLSDRVPGGPGAVAAVGRAAAGPAAPAVAAMGASAPRGDGAGVDSPDGTGSSQPPGGTSSSTVGQEGTGVRAGTAGSQDGQRHSGP